MEIDGFSMLIIWMYLESKSSNERSNRPTSEFNHDGNTLSVIVRFDMSDNQWAQDDETMMRQVQYRGIL